MTRPNKRKNKRKQIDDETFLRRLIDLGENRSALGRELGLTPSAVVMRLQRIDPEGKRLEAAKVNGRAAVIVHRAVGDVGFEAGANSAARHLKQVDNLAKYCCIIDQILDRLVEEMASRAGNSKVKLKPYHVEMVCKLVTQGRGLAETIHRIYADLSSVKETQAFFEAVVRVLRGAGSDDVKVKIYRELMALGHQEQAEILYSQTDKTSKLHEDGDSNGR